MRKLQLKKMVGEILEGEIALEILYIQMGEIFTQKISMAIKVEHGRL